MAYAKVNNKRKMFIGGAIPAAQLALNAASVIQSRMDTKNAERRARQNALRSEYNKDKAFLSNFNLSGSDSSVFKKGGSKSINNIKTNNPKSMKFKGGKLVNVKGSRNIYKAIGNSHEDGGIDITPNVEIEGDEYVKVDGRGIKVLSDDPSFASIPADQFENKARVKSPDKAFNEEFQKQEAQKGGYIKNKEKYVTGGEVALATKLAESAPSIDNLGNAILTFAKPKVPKPIYGKAVSLDTDVNINPQLSEVNRAASNIKRGIRGNFASPTATAALESKAENDALYQRNQLRNIEQAQERDLINKETEINQRVDESNRALAMDYQNRVANRKQEQIAEISGNLSNLQDDIVHKQNMNRLSDYQDKQLYTTLLTDPEGKTTNMVISGLYDTVLKRLDSSAFENISMDERHRNAILERMKTLGIE